MLNRSHHSVIESVGAGGDQNRAAAAARVSWPGCRVLQSQVETRSLIAGSGARLGSACSGDVDCRVQRVSISIKAGFRSDVVDLKLPAITQFLLHAGRPLDRVRRMELLWQNDELSLIRECCGGRRVKRQRERVAGCAAVRPWTAETHGNPHSNIRNCCGEGRVLIDSLRREEVR